MYTVFGLSDERILFTMYLAEISNRSHRTEVAGIHRTLLAKDANYIYRYSLSFHHCSGSTDSATFISILFRCTSSEAFLTTSSQWKLDSNSLKRFSFDFHIALLTLSVSSCALVFNQSSLTFCCSISDQVCALQRLINNSSFHIVNLVLLQSSIASQACNKLQHHKNTVPSCLNILL